MPDLHTLAMLIRGLASMKDENEYVEFKVSNADPDEIGERLSALSNMAALCHRAHGYLIWGVRDDDHAIVGTALSFETWKKGKEAIEAYWKNLLSPTVSLHLATVEIDGKNVLVAEVSAAVYAPTSFKGVAYCRITSYTKKLSEYPSIEKKLWEILADTNPEDRVVRSGLSEADVNRLLSIDSYYSLLGFAPSSIEQERFQRFVDEGFLIREADGYGVTMLGALLFARSLADFGKLESKAIRFVRYSTPSRLSTMGRDAFGAGYALEYERANEALLRLLAKPDAFVNGVRVDQYSLPPIALRELLANAIIHQDLNDGYGPLIEVFPDRVECSNTGILEVPPDRIIDTIPKPRNIKLAMFLRRANIGDSSGSGFDKIAYSMELEHLPAPDIAEYRNGVRVVLSFGRGFDSMDAREKENACYVHAVLCFLEHKAATNASLRERFGVTPEAKYQISRLLRSCVEAGLIRVTQADSKKESSYVPYWA